jgi:protein-L-isoaspartate(D-aspartate) O-methyltransferase
MDKAADLAQRLRAAIVDERVLAAIASIPRELFVPESQRLRAYDNVALPIDCGQTISQPLVVARMLELLQLRP